MKNDRIERKYEIWKTENEGKFVIVIPASRYRGDFSKFKNLLSIKKIDDKLLDRWKNQPESYESICNIIEFDNHYIDEDFIDKFIEHCNYLLFENLETNTYYDAFIKTFNYFSNMIKESTEKELQGDIGEAIFILEARKHGIDALKMLRKTDESTYDFYCENGLCIDVKTAIKSKNEIVISLKQNESVGHKAFVIVKLNLIEKGKTILDLYDEIGTQYLTDLLKEKKYKWQNNEEVIKNITIRDEAYEIDLLDQDAIPTYTVWENRSLKKIDFYIDVTDNLRKFEDIKTLIEKNTNV